MEKKIIVASPSNNMSNTYFPYDFCKLTYLKVTMSVSDGILIKFTKIWNPHTNVPHLKKKKTKEGHKHQNQGKNR